jgi:hypothetical protein
MSTMTLEQALSAMRSVSPHAEVFGDQVHEWADAIDAHLAQPAQAVDVGAIREVIDALRNMGGKPNNIYNLAADKLTRALAGEKAGPAGEWESAFHAQRAAAMRAHTICYETMLARPDVAELGDDGRLHDAIHDILRVDGPASPAPDKEGL